MPPKTALTSLVRKTTDLSSSICNRTRSKKFSRSKRIPMSSPSTASLSSSTSLASRVASRSSKPETASSPNRATLMSAPTRTPSPLTRRPTRLTSPSRISMALQYSESWSPILNFKMQTKMKTLMALALMTSLTTSISFADTVNFDEFKTGAPPPGWTATQTGSGKAKWEVVADNSALSKPNVLKQSGEATYPVCIKEDTNLKDGFVEVKFKPLAGKEDQAGGVLWRCKDPDNYYISRANALEDNVTIYHTVNGKRSEKKRINTKIASNQWHTLRVAFKDNYFV